jgi:hypothetical protein
MVMDSRRSTADGLLWCPDTESHAIRLQPIPIGISRSSDRQRLIVLLLFLILVNVPDAFVLRWQTTE